MNETGETILKAVSADMQQKTGLPVAAIIAGENAQAACAHAHAIVCQHADLVQNYFNENPTHCLDLKIEGKIVGHMCGPMAVPHKPRALRNGTIWMPPLQDAEQIFWKEMELTPADVPTVVESNA